ncbi:MAG TPA: RNA-binding cell elongation regulator Jag/EloR [Chloroflexota bacterium]|nr:RNA-binding cell elongation regulator Jag/EloR [Chloroflexota bacterium]
MTNERGAQSITVSAKTVAEATAEAAQKLGLPESELDVTVISEGSKGFLGMGGENARILAMPKAILARRAPQVPPAPDRAAATESIAPPSPRFRPITPRPQPAPVTPEPPLAEVEPINHVAAPQPAIEHEEDEEQPDALRTEPALVAEVAVEVVRELILHMGLDAQATVRSAGKPVIIDVQGADLGLLIGRHGDTLGAFQYLVNSIVGKRVDRWCKVVIDVEHYRLRREESLRSLANRQAARVRQTSQELTLDPMPAAERRIIHLTLQNSPWVVTNSTGEEPNRCVVIGPRLAER